MVFGPHDVKTAKARFNLAEAELGRGAVGEAIEHFAALVEPREDAPLPAEIVDLAAFGLARARWQAGEHRDEAIAAIEGLARRVPKDGSIGRSIDEWLAEHRR